MCTRKVAGSHRPHKITATITPEKKEQLKDILHQSPRNFNKETSLPTLDLLAEVSTSEKVAEQLVSGEAIRFDISWKRAKRWISSPDHTC